MTAHTIPLMDMDDGNCIIISSEEFFIKVETIIIQKSRCHFNVCCRYPLLNTKGRTTDLGIVRTLSEFMRLSLRCRISRDSHQIFRLQRLLGLFLRFSQSDRVLETGTHPELQSDTESKTQPQLSARKKSQEVSEV